MAEPDDLFDVFGDPSGSKDDNETNIVKERTKKKSFQRTPSSTRKRSLGAKPKQKNPDKRDEIVEPDKPDEPNEPNEPDEQDEQDRQEGDEPDTKKNKPTGLSEDDSLLEIVPQVEIHKLETVEGCTHEVAIPKIEGSYSPLKPSAEKPAKDYPFILDPFQKEALKCLENCQSVLVSAHTSAGKTVVAVYAIAMSLRDKQRVIYTTPIKALSNQKYRELYEEFQDVGLMTGDVTINPNASCLVMTTEILRSMLYRGSEIMREVSWVVFDEIHYMRDKERGVVWEETIILLPDNVHYVFLSATIPNAGQFAEWICHLHKQPCHVVYTDYRPVPLQHYIFPSGGDGLHLVVDENGTFREDNFDSAMSVLREAGEASKGDQALRGRKGGTKGPSNCFKIVKMIMERNFAPVIVFSFSKKECEAYALQMSKLDFNNAAEKKLVEEVFFNAIDCLSDDDKKLPQVEHVLPLLKRGIGIHHSGLLPILKESIEILFSEGLIKALFATETFSMGLNMPARTVLFTSTRKFDGKDFRWISSGEYIQMSGRAGRRGIDDRGIVILMIDEKMSPAIGKNLLKGDPDPLNSAFHLTYNMVLNLLRVEDINPEYMLERSFHQYQNFTILPSLFDKLKTLQVKHDSFVIPNEENVESYYKLRQQLEKLRKDLQGYIIKPKYSLPFLQPGRMVKVKNAEDDFGWGVVINYQKKANQSRASQDNKPLYIAEVLLNCSKESLRNSATETARPKKQDGKGEMQVVPLMLHLIEEISSVRLYLPKDLRSRENRQSVGKSIDEVILRFPDGLPHLDPIDDMGIKDPGFKKVVEKIESLEHRLYRHPLHDKLDLETFTMYKEKAQTAADIKVAKNEFKRAKTILQMDELKSRKRVLRRLGYSTSSDVIELKGRVACEISSADELLLTEMIFNGTFNDLNVGQIVALLSCFVFQEKASEMPKLTDELSGPLRQMQEFARRIAKISSEAKLDIEENAYVDSFRPHLMDIVYAWANGATFGQICKMTDVFEGSIIRCMRRLEELLNEMCNAAKAIGNNSLENKFAEGITKIKRDIVFAASLYL